MSNEPHIDITVVVPLFNEAESLKELYAQITDALSDDYQFEVIFVDDGSDDESFDVIKELGRHHSNVKGISFRRNYGKSSALQKGFEQSEGRYIITMDADLQDDPHEIPEMVQMLKDGLDLVSGWKKKRHDPISKTIPSRFFNKVTSKMSGIKLHDFNCGLKAYKREVIEHIYLYGEMHRYVPLLSKWQGFDKIGEKVVTHHPRKFGKSKFGLNRFINGFLDLITLLFVNKFAQKPMHFFGSIGSISLLAGGIITVYLTYMRIFYDMYLSNRPLLIFGVLFVILGIQFFSIGFVGELIINRDKKQEQINFKDSTGLTNE